MSSRSASQRFDDGAVRAPAADTLALGERWLERLTGVRSSKPTFYGEWRRTSRGLDRAVEALKAISIAFGTSTRGPQALCRAVLRAVGPPFDASFVAMVLAGRHVAAGRLPGVIAWPEPVDAARAGGALPARLREIADRAAAGGPVVAEEGRGSRSATVAVPMRAGGETLGTLLLVLPDDAFDDSALTVLEALSNQVAVTIENACLYEESEHLRAHSIAACAEAERQAEELEKRNRQLERARQRLVGTQKRQLIGEERNRIARELHDTVAQHLVSIGMNLEWCRKHEPDSSPVHERVSVSKELARSALSHIRTTIFELGSLEETPFGLGPALRDLAEEFRATAWLDVCVRIRGAPCQLPLPVEHALFRVAQEAMWNVAKHAGAKHAWIELERGADVLRLSVSDDGTGDAGAIRRDLEQVRSSSRRSRLHRGLANIGERADEIHGTVHVRRRRGGGVRLMVTTPVERAGTDVRA